MSLPIEALIYLSPPPLLHRLVLDEIIISPEAIIRLQQGRTSPLLLLAAASEQCVKDTDGYTRPFRSAPMVNFNGKLASLGPEETVDGSCESNRLRVLEDVETGEWSERTFVLPEVWKSVVGRTFVRFVGVTRSDEIVLYSSSLQYLVYYNTERNTVVRVDIQGMEAFMGFQIFTLQDHIEDVRLTKV
uniref:F-box associated beta-propeller type 3 domain-containing protein n=1 Tax=Brassica campestris TaxID=3711 RepID=M4F1W0_BRACM